MDKHNDRKDLELTVRETRNAVKATSRTSRQPSLGDDFWFTDLSIACKVPTIERS